MTEQIWEQIGRDDDDGAAAKSHLAAGRPIYYCEDAYPEHMIRKWPDGRRELITLGQEGEILVERSLEEG